MPISNQRGEGPASADVDCVEFTDASGRPWTIVSLQGRRHRGVPADQSAWRSLTLRLTLPSRRRWLVVAYDNHRSDINEHTEPVIIERFRAPHRATERLAAMAAAVRKRPQAVAEVAAAVEVEQEDS